jgi:hypothetical protein
VYGALRVDHDHAVHHGVHHGLDARHCFGEDARGVFALAQIADDPDEGRLAVDRGLPRRNLHRERRAVAPPARHRALMVAARLGARLRRGLAACGGAERPWQHARDVVPDHVGGRMAEQLLARRIEHEHAIVGIDHDDAVDREIHHGAENGLTLLPRHHDTPELTPYVPAMADGAGPILRASIFFSRPQRAMVEPVPPFIRSRISSCCCHWLHHPGSSRGRLFGIMR